MRRWAILVSVAAHAAALAALWGGHGAPSTQPIPRAPMVASPEPPPFIFIRLEDTPLTERTLPDAPVPPEIDPMPLDPPEAPFAEPHDQEEPPRTWSVEVLVARLASRADVTAPVPRENPPPEYPEAAIRRGWEGRVVVRVRVSVEGRAIRVTVHESSGHAVLDDAAVEAVRQWRFDPARRGDGPIEGTVDVPVRFRLNRE